MASWNEIDGGNFWNIGAACQLYHYAYNPTPVLGDMYRKNVSEEASLRTTIKSRLADGHTITTTARNGEFARV